MSDILTISREGCSIHNPTWTPGQLALNDFTAADTSHTINNNISIVSDHPLEFPKYTTQLLNPANNFSNATHANVVGDMNQLMREFNSKHPAGGFSDWVNFYHEEHNGRQRISRGTEKMYPMVVKMRSAFEQIDKQMCRDYIRDLVLYKTYRGFDVEKMILKTLADRFCVSWEKSSSDEETMGIDGYLADTAVQIKPESYKNTTSGEHDCPIIFYKRDENNGVFVVDFSQVSERFCQ